MLVIGFIGVFMCMASMVLLGGDVSRYINDAYMEKIKSFKITKILDVMHSWMPDFWGKTVAYINDAPVSMQKTFAIIFLNLPASLVGLMIGITLVVIGFKIQRYHIE